MAEGPRAAGTSWPMSSGLWSEKMQIHLENTGKRFFLTRKIDKQTNKIVNGQLNSCQYVSPSHYNQSI